MIKKKNKNKKNIISDMKKSKEKEWDEKKNKNK
jgi:hypothetical protein